MNWFSARKSFQDYNNLFYSLILVGDIGSIAVIREMIDYIIEELKDNPLKTIAVVVGTIVTLIYFIHGTSLPPINNEIMNPVNNTNLPPMVVSLMSDMMNPQEAGTTIKWTATALDPEKDPIQYKFLLDGQQKTDWSYNSTWYWTTSSADIGSHMIVIKIKDGRHQVDGDDAKDIHFTISPDAMTWYYKGNTLYYQGNYDDAIQAYEKAIELKPDLAEAWNSKGIVLYHLGKYDDAIRAYEMAIGLKPDLAEAWNNEGHALYYLGNYDDAIQAYERAIGLKSDLAIELKPDLAEAWNSKGIALYRQDKYDDAVQASEKAIELKPDLAEAWNNEGHALKALKRTTDANAAFAKATELGYKPSFWDELLT